MNMVYFEKLDSNWLFKNYESTKNKVFLNKEILPFEKDDDGVDDLIFQSGVDDFEPCKLTLHFQNENTENGYFIKEVRVISNARYIELYDHNDEYLETLRGGVIRKNEVFECRKIFEKVVFVEKILKMKMVSLKPEKSKFNLKCAIVCIESGMKKEPTKKTQPDIYSMLIGKALSQKLGSGLDGNSVGVESSNEVMLLSMMGNLMGNSKLGSTSITKKQNERKEGIVECVEKKERDEPKCIESEKNEKDNIDPSIKEYIDRRIEHMLNDRVEVIVEQIISKKLKSIGLDGLGT